MASRTLLIGLLTALASPLLLAQASPPTPQPPPATPPAGVDLTADEAPSLR
jgi:hypothetical protein